MQIGWSFIITIMIVIMIFIIGIIPYLSGGRKEILIGRSFMIMIIIVMTLIMILIIVMISYLSGAEEGDTDRRIIVIMIVILIMLMINYQ